MQKVISIKSWLMLSLGLSLCCASCGSKSEGYSEIHEKSRDNIVEAHPISIEDSLPEIHSAANIFIIGDTLLIDDRKSTENRYFGYDISANTQLGWFGKIGQGPGELTNVGSVYINPNRREITGFDLGTMDVKAFQIDSALADLNCPAKTLIEYDAASNGFLLSPCFLNDTTVFARTYIYDYDTYTGSNRIVRFNPLTAVATPIGEASPLLEKSFSIALDHNNNHIYLMSHYLDLIQIYDLDGNLLKSIYGNDFTDDNPNDRIEYFGKGITDNTGRLYVTYNGRERANYRQRDIIVYSPEGKYLKTIRFDVRLLWDLAYHEPTNRLYFSCDGEPQFGYINLSEHLDD